jgi:hypothetical protein
MAKKLCLVLSALSLIPAQVFGYGAYYYGSGQGTFNKGRMKTNRSTSSRTSSAAPSGGYGGLYSNRSASVTSGRGFSGGGLRGFGTGGFGAGAFGSSSTPSHTSTQTQSPTTTATSPQVEGARVLSPAMFSQSVASNPPPQYFSVPAGGLITIDDNKAQAMTGVGVFMGQPDLPPGSSASQSGGYGGSLYSNSTSH